MGAGESLARNRDQGSVWEQDGDGEGNGWQIQDLQKGGQGFSSEKESCKVTPNANGAKKPKKEADNPVCRYWVIY